MSEHVLPSQNPELWKTRPRDSLHLLQWPTLAPHNKNPERNYQCCAVGGIYIPSSCLREEIPRVFLLKASNYSSDFDELHESLIYCNALSTGRQLMYL